MEFEIKSDRGYSILFHSQEYNKDGWLEYYSVTLTAPNMNAIMKVDNSPIGITPVEFFENIASNWSGWRGEKGWSSLEGEFDLSATSDSTGHITLVARVNSGYFTPSSKMTIEFEVEAGQLEHLNKKAGEFFK